MLSWPLLLPSFGLSSSLFFSLRLLLFIHFGESPLFENLFPPIFWHNQKIYAKKKYFFVGNFYFFTKKRADFRAFFYFLRPAFGRGSLNHQQSLEYFLQVNLQCHILSSHCCQGVTADIKYFLIGQEKNVNKLNYKESVQFYETFTSVMQVLNSSRMQAINSNLEEGDLETIFLSANNVLIPVANTFGMNQHPTFSQSPFSFLNLSACSSTLFSIYKLD